MRAYELYDLIRKAMDEKGYGSMPITVVVQGKIYSIKDVTWCVNSLEFHIYTEDNPVAEIGFRGPRFDESI